MREQRFCTCGYSVFGNDLERRNALAAHRASKDHEKQERENAIEGAAIGWILFEEGLRDHP